MAKPAKRKSGAAADERRAAMGRKGNDSPNYSPSGGSWRNALLVAMAVAVAVLGSLLSPKLYEFEFSGNTDEPTRCDLEGVLQTEFSAPGCHALCFQRSFRELVVYRNLVRVEQPYTAAMPTAAFKSMKLLRKALGQIFELDEEGSGLRQPFGLFTKAGERVTSLEAAVMAKTPLLLFEGGQFVWPGVKIGYTRSLPIVDTDGVEIVMHLETLSLRPLVLQVHNFLRCEECDHIIERSKMRMKPSGVSHIDQDKGKPATQWRTSSQTFLRRGQDAVLQRLENRVEQLTRVPSGHGEHVQVLRYEYRQKYDAHNDYFDAALYKKDQNMLELIDYGARNRLARALCLYCRSPQPTSHHLRLAWSLTRGTRPSVPRVQATVFWYMSNVTRGGETVFPRSGGLPQPHDFTDCTRGLLVRPTKGKVIVFYSLTPDGMLDPYSLHGGCPVMSSESTKWAANQWLWNKPVSF